MKKRTRKRTKPGRVIKTTRRLNTIMARSQWIYFNGRAYHPGWVRSWRYDCVCGYLLRGLLREALRLDGEPFTSEVIW